MSKKKLQKVDTQALAQGRFVPSQAEDAVTIVTPLDELTDADKEDLQEFATLVLNMRTAKRPHTRCGSRR